MKTILINIIAQTLITDHWHIASLPEHLHIVYKHLYKCL